MDLLVERYRAIGLPSPLARIAKAQRDGLRAVSDRAHSGEYEVYEGLKCIAPFISTTIDTIATDGITPVIGLPLAPGIPPIRARTTITRARLAIEAHPCMIWLPVRSWPRPPEPDPFLKRTADGLEGTAWQVRYRGDLQRHSLPWCITEIGDSHKDEVVGLTKAVELEAVLRQDRYYTDLAVYRTYRGTMGRP